MSGEAASMPKFSWEDEMPTQCKKCPHFRFISGILLMNADLKRDRDELKSYVELIERVLKSFRAELRRSFEAEMDLMAGKDLRKKGVRKGDRGR